MAQFQSNKLRAGLFMIRQSYVSNGHHVLGRIIFIFMFLVFSIFVSAADQADLSSINMPRLEDYTVMWWHDGFPSHTPEAPWIRCIQTGRYAMALDTKTMKVPHFGIVHQGGSYADCAVMDNSEVNSLPKAELILTINSEGKTYRCTRGGEWNQNGGPRLVESGRFFQRADVTDLEFTAEDGARLNVEARFETAAWPDRLSLILAARPGLLSIQAGENCFGRVGGGFGLDGTNHFEVPDAPDPEQFTLEFWAFVPVDFKVSDKTPPWLVCKNAHEQADGNYGIVLHGDLPQARINIGGGRDNAFTVDARRGVLKIDEWNHMALSYDGDTLRFYVNGRLEGQQKTERKRVPVKGGLAFGRRQDNCGDGFHFRGVVDEICLYDMALKPEAVSARASKPGTALPDIKPVHEWSFRPDGLASAVQPGEQWHNVGMTVSLKTSTGKYIQDWNMSKGETWSHSDWREVAVSLHPGPTGASDSITQVNVSASEFPSGVDRPVEYDAARGWYKVNLDNIVPVKQVGKSENDNDAIERVRLVLANPDANERVVKLLFAKNASGMKVRVGTPITGVSAILRDCDGNPTGIPVQLSKNWHSRASAGIYAGAWFHGFSQVRLPPSATVELELVMVYGHWGGVAAASHAQLCLIGWGSNQLWDESALGSWGESICYEPDQAQAHAGILDVRPVMVSGMNDAKWNWTHNVGGGDFFRYFDSSGKRVFPVRMKTAYMRQCPVLTEVLYAGHTADGKIEHQVRVSLHRSDDILRGIYRVRMDVKEETDFSRFVFFQIGADTYSYTSEHKMAVGNEDGLIREWDTQWGEGVYKTKPMECVGRVPWISLHQAVSRAGEQKGAWANRGIVIREWKARLGGKDSAPWVAEFGPKARGKDTSTADLVPPPGMTRFLPGDFIEATFEHVIMPQFAADYYGPNENLRKALTRDENTWRMIQREAVGNELQVHVSSGKLERLYPAVRIRTDNGQARFVITGGLGYIPITLCALKSFDQPLLEVRCDDGAWKRVDQSMHGNDFWQTDYDPSSNVWEITFSVQADTPSDKRIEREYRFSIESSSGATAERNR